MIICVILQESAERRRQSEQLFRERNRAKKSFGPTNTPTRQKESDTSIVHVNTATDQIVDPVMDEADGWAHIVSTSRQPIDSRSNSIEKAQSSLDGREAEQWLFFEIADTGVGIAPKGLKALFREFVQVRIWHDHTVNLRL